MKKIFLTLSLLLTFSFAVFAQNSDKPMLFRQPTMNKTDIVFVFGGDLWKVSRNGGNAERLTSGAGNESSPSFFAGRKFDCFYGRI